MSHAGRPQNTLDLDSLSLQQALRDFEAANARVIDLTQRLLTSEQQRRQLADELERARQQLQHPDTQPGPTVVRRGLRAAKGLVKSLYTMLRN